MKPKEIPKKVQHILSSLPKTPGIYQMLNSKNEIVYIGKAKNLKSRVSSYFQTSKGHSYKVQKMVPLIEDIKIIKVENELEALILETNYIKKHKPKYNILMRDDKHFNYIKITTNEDYPRIYTTRKVSDDNALYFGPKTSSKELYQTLKLLRKLFPYRTCTLDIKDKGDHVEIKKKTINIPCIYYHIHRCIGPCIVPCKDEYSILIQNIKDFLSGNYTPILKSVESKMKHYAENRMFEKAAKERDMIFSIKNLMEKQIVDQRDVHLSLDVIGSIEKFGKIFINLFQVRGGKLIGQEDFVMEMKGASKKDTEKEVNSTNEILSSFITQFYQTTNNFPKEIVIEQKLEDVSILEAFISERRGKKTTIGVPLRGTKKKLLELTKKNATTFAERQKISWMTESGNPKTAIKNLANALELPTTLARIECYDISHLGGTQTVGSMVVFENGIPNKKEYRRFKVKTLDEGAIDDFESMREVLTRRLKKIQSPSKKKKKGSFESVPDLIIIDGGKGQLSAVMEIANKLDSEVPIVSLAKKKEEIFRPGKKESLLLPENSPELFLVQNIRDEAHRFAITYNRNLRKKQMVKSILDEIPGIGPQTKKKLIKHFGSTKDIEQASLEDVANIVGEKLASTIKEYL